MNKYAPRFILFSILVMLAGCVTAGSIRCDTELSVKQRNENGYQSLNFISIVSVIADPDKYDGKRISVVGVFVLHYDRAVLYITKDHLQADEFTSAIFADLPKCITLENMELMSEWNGKFVRIDGVFDSDRRTTQVDAGTITNVESIELYYSESGS